MSRAVWVLVVAALPWSALQAQVEPVVTMREGYAHTLVVNSGTDTVQYRVELVARTMRGDTVQLGRLVLARISPAAFQLAPGERQVVRIRLSEPSPTPTLGLAITMTPSEAITPRDSGATAARLVIVLRHVAKVLLQ